jgi:hypothetical protein
MDVEHLIEGDRDELLVRAGLLMAQLNGSAADSGAEVASLNAEKAELRTAGWCRCRDRKTLLSRPCSSGPSTLNYRSSMDPCSSRSALSCMRRRGTFTSNPSSLVSEQIGPVK